MSRFVVLYGGAINEEGRLNPDSVSRCEAAVRSAQKSEESKIIFGVGHSIPGLHDATIAWLRDKGWPPERLIVNPKAHNSLGEAEAAIEVLAQYAFPEVIIATSWCHIPRVWLIWQLLYRGHFSFAVAWAVAHPFKSLLWECMGFAKLFLTVVRQPLRFFGKTKAV